MTRRFDGGMSNCDAACNSARNIRIASKNAYVRGGSRVYQIGPASQSKGPNYLTMDALDQRTAVLQSDVSNASHTFLWQVNVQTNRVQAERNNLMVDELTTRHSSEPSESVGCTGVIYVVLFDAEVGQSDAAPPLASTSEVSGRR